jgi:GTP-binding protein Era
MTAKETRAGFVAIVGAPNAGKSTLLNQILGEKLAIVSPKVQTTRFNIRGILTENERQLIFVDTPGIHKPRRDFDAAMVQAACDAWQEADVILLVVDATKGFNQDVKMVLENIEKAKQPVILALNKVDQLKDKEKLLPLMAEAQDMNRFADVFALTALQGKGVSDLVNVLGNKVPVSPYLYGEDALTDLPLRILAAEITRERAFIHLQQELPYAVMVETETFQETDELVRVRQNVLVQRDGQKKIVLGRGGQMIKTIGTESRQQLEKLLEKKVMLELKVKVRPNWPDNTWLLAEQGLQPAKK